MLFRDQSREKMSVQFQHTDRIDEHASNVNLEDSLAHPDRKPEKVKGLTEFLRKEYFRKNGVYCNGSANELTLLSDLWKFHISERHKHEQEIKRKEDKERRAVEKLKAMQELEKKDPVAYRRKKHEAEQKAIKKEEQEKRAQNIMEKSMTAKRPQSGAASRPKDPKTGHTWVPPGMQAIGTQKGKGGGAVAAAVQAEPSSEKNPYYYYDKFKKEFELDVLFTIQQDLTEEKMKLAEKTNSKMKQDEEAMMAEYKRRDKAVSDAMVDIFFYEQAKQKDVL